METIKDDRFGTVWLPDFFFSMLSYVLSEEEDHPFVRMWRGHAKSSWLLDSSVFRKLKLRNTAPSERSVAYYESYLLDKAKHKGFHWYE